MAFYNEEDIAKFQEKANNIIIQCTTPINEIIDVILKNTIVAANDSKIGLSMDDLYAIAVRLPAECSYLQAQINNHIIKQKVQSFITEIKITNAIVTLQDGKGDAKERQRRAEAMAKDEVLSDIITQQIVTALQTTVQRADKVYEGVKKIIDAKSREFSLDKKPGHPIGEA